MLIWLYCSMGNEAKMWVFYWTDGRDTPCTLGLHWIWEHLWWYWSFSKDCMQERKLEIRRKGGLNIWSGWGGSTTVTTPNPTNLTQTWWVFTNEAIGPMISVFMRMMFQVWTSTQSWFSWPKSKVGWSTSGYFWLTLADERTSLEKYNFCCG